MTRSRPITLLASAAVLALVGLSVAACGGMGAATASPWQATSNGHPLWLVAEVGHRLRHPVPHRLAHQVAWPAFVSFTNTAPTSPRGRVR